MKKLLPILFLLLIPSLLLGQTTTVSGPIVDQRGNTWSYATVTAFFSPTPNTPGPFNWSGGSFNLAPPTVTADSGGNFSLVLANNSAIAPSGSGWYFSVCPNATLPCAVVTLGLSGGTVNISTAITNAGTWPPGFVITTQIAKFYNVNQTQGCPPVNQGGMAYNTATNTMFVCTNSGFQPFATVGGIPVITNPSGTQNITQPLNTNFNIATSGTGHITENNFPVINSSSSVAQKISAIYQINGDLYMDGVQFPTLSAAVAAIPSGGTVRISAGSYTISSSLVLASDVDIECSPNNKTVLIASASLNAPMVTGTSINHTRTAGCVFDGNRSGNSNLFGGITLTTATNNQIVNNHFQNFSGGRIINLASGANFNTIQDNEIDHFGQALPASINGNECIAIAPTTSVGVQDNDIIHNYCHDGNGGIALYNNGSLTPSTTANTSRNRILYNKVQFMANDAFVLFSDPTANPTGTAIVGNIFEANIARCNGWPANGTSWDSTSCPPGFLQSGANAGQGVGFNQNSNQATQNQFIGNRAEYNFYEGADDTPQIYGMVNTSNGAIGSCSANCVQWVSGGPFQVGWKTNQAIDINGTFYSIASVQSSTIMTLASAPGTNTNVYFNGFTNSNSIWKGNYFYSNGNGAPTGGQGSGLAIQGGYVTSEGNTSYNNAFSGFFDQAPIYVSHVGDHSLYNCRVAACNEFNVEAALNPIHIGVVSDSSSSNNALYWSGGTNNGYAEATSLCNTTGCGTAVIQDNGISDVFNNGKVRGSAGSNGGTHAECFAAGGGTSCINGQGNGYSLLPNGGTVGSPLILGHEINGTAGNFTATLTNCTLVFTNGSVTSHTGTACP